MIIARSRKLPPNVTFVSKEVMQRIPVDLRSQGHPRRAQPPIPTPSAQSDRVRAETFSEIKETSTQLRNATKTSLINSQRSRGEEAAGWEAELYLYLQHVAVAPPPAPAVMATQSLLPARGRGTCVVLCPTRRPDPETRLGADTPPPTFLVGIFSFRNSASLHSTFQGAWIFTNPTPWIFVWKRSSRSARAGARVGNCPRL